MSLLHQSLPFKRWSHQAYNYKTSFSNRWIKHKGKQNVAPGNLLWNSAEERQEVTYLAKIFSHFCNFEWAV